MRDQSSAFVPDRVPFPALARGELGVPAQPVLTLGWSALLLGEHVGAAMLVAAPAPLVLTAGSQRTRGRPVAARPAPGPVGVPA
jgi:hypothetical protein